MGGLGGEAPKPDLAGWLAYLEKTALSQTLSDNGTLPVVGALPRPDVAESTPCSFGCPSC